eukprot:FR735162.1.p2 GENE.FR735162.1~~FR735162.1.p2  ORF type:complete len:127 (+),score=52.44 FR735162.1:819-1199(+)
MNELNPINCRCAPWPLFQSGKPARPPSLKESAHAPGKGGFGIWGLFPLSSLHKLPCPRGFSGGGEGGITLPPKGGKNRVFSPKIRGKKTRGKKKYVETKKAPPNKGPQKPPKKKAPRFLWCGFIFP